MTKHTVRNNYLDFLKGFAIIFVVLGHSIQLTGGIEFANYLLFFYNPLFIIIYSFHMPLFMLISGYLFSFTSKKRNIGSIIKNRIRTLLVPITIWTLIWFTIDHYLNGKMLLSLNEVLEYFTGTFWFLWSVLVCSLIVMLVDKTTKGKLSFVIYCIIFALSFISLDQYSFHMHKYMFPFFLAGYYTNKYENTLKVSKRVEAILACICLIVFGFLFKMYTIDTSIYISMFSILGRSAETIIYYDMYRYAIGFVGCFLALFALKHIYKWVPDSIKHWISDMGKNSLGIYIISNFLFIFLIKRLFAPLQGLNYCVVGIVSIIMLLLCNVITQQIKKSKICSVLLFGR
ncbi:hypothetical protein AOC36_08475 [Erysipelothrix larvae]|uniref:Acyltransferase 3 domain-containing protein n=1 Tax=Erysipelothrix larvae TaxID=1514105 RepID=A0A0X8H1A8_9FIRM|nr:acyltransferase family protein [Erysipelothrix larvae]AMC94019.1 hypothetical protein AOC36_08475 [Erysipelothrix larvae]